ncbi:FG-GAP repeat domain-containing protein [Pseudohongiella sp.]|uniref:VCBS repeat-containing protein n=1 Tax=marine sediment metagenome TaxID=412755 RepID=A0A0F9Z5R9_9ZZZZ|nr:VCBS repeat-containing protein [Pseudohongiella sp.]HDZ09678.1 VCBS repeat-containing protein [Pseudohongiella sp.]HEA61867.1 VCBS repeat-containing protein [Pseudohongiella sp.]
MRGQRLTLVAAWLIAGISLSGPGALAQSEPRQLNYIASEIPSPEWPNRLAMADLDGDGREDLILPQWTADTGRQLLVFLQQTNNRFPAQASRYIAIVPEIVAVSFADLRPQPGAELLLFTGTAAFSLSSAIDGYSGNIRPLFDWSLAAAIPDRRVVEFLPPPEDINGDGHVDLLLPGPETYGVWHGAPDEQFTLAHRFSTVNEDLDPADLPDTAGRFSTQVQFNRQDGLVVRINARPNTAFEDFLDHADSDDSNVLLDRSVWLPPAVLRNMTQSDSDDIVFLNIGNDIRGQINVLAQRSDGTYSEQPDWQGPIDMEGDILLQNINGDDLTDVVRVVEDANDWTVHFYLNRGGHFDFDQPDQVMRFSGYDLQLNINDILGDGHPELSISYYTIPVVNAIRNTSIVRTQLLYGSNNNQDQHRFNNRPDFSLEESFSASSIRGLSSPIVIDTDLDGDGRADALYLTADGTLAAKAINSNLQFADTPFWQYVPQRTIIGFSVQDLNADGIPDLLLNHSNSMTVLVSSP